MGYEYQILCLVLPQVHISYSFVVPTIWKNTFHHETQSTIQLPTYIYVYNITTYVCNWCSTYTFFWCIFFTAWNGFSCKSRKYSCYGTSRSKYITPLTNDDNFLLFVRSKMSYRLDNFWQGMCSGRGIMPRTFWGQRCNLNFIQVQRYSVIGSRRQGL